MQASDSTRTDQAEQIVQSRRVLVVDDCPDLARTLEELLELLGHHAASASDGQRALQTAEAFRPDVVLLDLGMPGMDGFEVARRLRAAPTSRDAALVALTGWSDAAAQARAADVRFDHHLPKPTRLATLAGLLARL